MDNFTFVPSAPISHNVEMYTERFLVQGIVRGPFKRTSDLLNHREHSFIAVEEASILPLGQQADPSKLSTPVMISKNHLHLVATAPYMPDAQPQGGSPAGGGTSGREYYVQKDIYACYALTDTFVIFGQCHLRQGTNLQTLLEIGDTFLPITNTTVSLLARPSAIWKRDLVLVNKTSIEVMYLDE